jgi:hypothetical protein
MTYAIEGKKELEFSLPSHPILDKVSLHDIRRPTGRHSWKKKKNADSIQQTARIRNQPKAT